MRIKVIITLTFLLSIISSNLFAFCYEDAGRQYDLNPLLLMAVSKTESNYNPLAVNTNSDGTQDIGLMQINSSWIKNLNLNPGLLLSDPCYNLKTGANILNKCIERYGYTWEAVGCYNATSRHKRAKYSWKIFDKLKAEDNMQKAEKDKKSRNKKSEFFFSTRDKTPMEKALP
ncbi:MAG: lytic transglycosylase domain-containing protein [Nitrospirae bacterium]|nr:lytic transglycosylase domain-containing protein [Nitrospirota bacterium]